MNNSPFFSLAADEVLKSFGSDHDRGLDSATVAERQTRLGMNELREAPPVPWWRNLLSQFQELVIWILIAAALISGATGDWPDTCAILAIVLVNGIIGYLQEQRAEQALAALKKLSAPSAKVIRDGVLTTMPARELVPGDRIELEAGDNVPADARLVTAFSLRALEASLTGESVPTEKQADCILPDNTSLGDRRNMVFMSTVVAAGKAHAVVTATGMETELGRIAGLLERHTPEPTPLQRRLAELGRVLVVICLVIVVVIFCLELVRGRNTLNILLRAVSLAVAAVPEGLPAVVTLALALGLQRMVARNVLIRRLPSVETLGSVTVICSDKTGTLTRNEMTVRFVLAGGRRYEMTGSRSATLAGFMESPTERPPGAAKSPVDPSSAPDLVKALTIGARCNHAQVAPAGDGYDSSRIIGDPTEAALVVAALKAKIPANDPATRVLYELPFDSDRKTMSVVMAGSNAAAVMYTKGAPEVVLHRCTSESRDGRIVPMDAARRQELIVLNSELAAQALRVLALAYREYADAIPDSFQENELVFAGLVGMIDPPRDEARIAIDRCRGAGIRPVMITGDHPDTASAISRELRLATGDDQTMTGRQLDVLDDAALERDVERIAVYARVSPEHKLRVVRAWKSRGHIVAMTGDGVNDAPAMKAADIGIAMGITGTDVTKEASDMILTDDNFSSIVNAIEEGRGIFDNIQKFVHYLLSCNAGEVLLMFFAALVGWPAPLEALQLLWINLVTDGLPALALGMEPPERDIMNRPPRPPRQPVITFRGGLLMLFHGLMIAGVAIVGFALVMNREVAGGTAGNSLTIARTTAFCITSFSQLLFSFSCRSHRRTMPELGLFSNPQLIGAVVISTLLQLAVVTLPMARPVFDTTTLLFRDWMLIIALSAIPVTVIELLKLAAAWRGTSRSAIF